MTNIYKPTQSNWLNPNIEYLFNATIVEYDIKEAGYSIIKQFKLLPVDTIRSLSVITAKERIIAIGKLQRDDKEFSNKLLEKFALCRSAFITKNKLSDNDIISVKKDALFITRSCKYTVFDKIKFVEKNKYSSYIRLVDNNNIELYYNTDGIDIKGIGAVGISLHKLYMVQFLRKSISLIECQNKSIKRYLKNFISKYKSLEMNDEFYITFNNMSRDYNPMFNYQKVVIPILQIALKEMRDM